MSDPSIARFRRVISSAYASLEARRQEVNDLNVFPVADGDTGDNMAMTMRAVMEELDRFDKLDVDRVDRTELVQALARAALMGARGNSGVILSQIVSGAQQDAVLAEVLERAIEEGERAVARTPEQLDVLRESGVVDAGGHGLVLILAGVVAALRGDDEMPEISHYDAPRRSLPHHEDSRYRYCTNFIVSGRGLENREYLPRLEKLGDSVLVVGDDVTLKVHVHTDEPEAAVTVFDGVGEVTNLDVADMREQMAERDARLGG